MKNRVRLLSAALFCFLGILSTIASGANYEKKATWRETLEVSLGFGPSEVVAKAIQDFPLDRQQLEIVADWIRQDGVDENRPSNDSRWAMSYLKQCESRRARRLEPHQDRLRRIVFTKHYDLGGSHYAYTEGLSDAQAERHFKSGTALCVLEMDGSFGSVRTLIEDPKGTIRDPDVSFDGRRILFAWKKSDREDDYHLYEIRPDDGNIRQLTTGLGYADYEGVYLPDGNLMFNSTRSMQIVDCWWTEVSNLFLCDGDGQYMRQIAFDQVHSNYPTVTHDGRVIYTRWDYNDRGQIYPQGLFQTNQDGTGQTEVYGNNSFFPTTIMHARSIPGTSQILSIFSGHHTRQYGLLGILDPRKGRQENSGAQLIAPIRDTPAVHVDAYGRNDEAQFQYPYPLNETDCLVGFRLKSKTPHFGLFWMTVDGKRELLVSDPKISCSQPIPLCERPIPAIRSNSVDYRQTEGTVYLQDIYSGPGLTGVTRGTIKELRVIALEFRAAGVGNNGNRGPAGGALVSTPISIQGAWDVKRVIGTAKVHEDGSACFTVPARTPLYFQALDEQGQMVQSMRSWLTMQPGESVSCIGCHENKNGAPPSGPISLAIKLGPQKLRPFYGPARGFSFVKEIQPILDRHCISCHHLDKSPQYPSVAKSDDAKTSKDPIRPAFSLKGTQTLDTKAKRNWSASYKALADRKICNWINVQSAPPMLPPYHAGASQSRLITLLRDGHEGVRLSQEELDRFIVWIDVLVPYVGDYTEAMTEDGILRYNKFLEKRQRWHAEEAKNIAAHLRAME